MGKGKEKPKVDRRNFLSGVAAGGAASGLAVANLKESDAQDTQARGVSAPSAAELEREYSTSSLIPNPSSQPKSDLFGSDFMIDVIKTLDIEYIFSNPGSSFLGLHESIINHGGNVSPEFITCMHEESAVAMANGYYKAAGRPAAAMCHGTVGLQHAAMALYNAWCDRVPLISILGNTLDGTHRRGGNDWRHSAQDPVAMVRDFTKWDDQPISLQGFAESMVHGYKISTTPPMEPVAIVVDSSLQEMGVNDSESLSIPKFTPSKPPQGELGSIKELAKLLVSAERPLIIVDRMVRSSEGMSLLVELSELINVPVVDLASRQNMPSMHYLNQTQNALNLIPGADVILGLEVTDFWGQINLINRIDGSHFRRVKPNAKLVTIGVNDLYLKSNYQDFQRYAPVDISISGDGEATLPSLIEEVKFLLTQQQKRNFLKRKEDYKKLHSDAYERSRKAASYGWDSSPISTSRMCMDLWHLIKNEDWSLVSVGASEHFISQWPHKLWNFDKHYRYLGYGAGGGVGYGLPAAVGAAMANKSLGRFSVNIQCDGDFMYANGALWTAAHHRVPLLTVMHNNRSYGQETMLLQGIMNHRERGIDKAKIGTVIDDPSIDYAKLAQGMGVWAEGPISDPNQLAPALSRAIEVVKSGYPALVDVVTQVR